MNLYFWYSQYLKNYGLGEIVVMASSEEEARAKAWTAFDEYTKYHYEGYTPEERAEERRFDMATFAGDIDKSPRVVSSGVVFVEGSH